MHWALPSPCTKAPTHLPTSPSRLCFAPERRLAQALGPLPGRPLAAAAASLTAFCVLRCAASTGRFFTGVPCTCMQYRRFLLSFTFYKARAASWALIMLAPSLHCRSSAVCQACSISKVPRRVHETTRVLCRGAMASWSIRPVPPGALVRGRRARGTGPSASGRSPS